MNTSIVLTVIADDQPGIIEAVSKTLANHDGNWTQSSMSSLAGQFAGILLASVPEQNAEACIAELRSLEDTGLRGSIGMEYGVGPGAHVYGGANWSVSDNGDTDLSGSLSLRMEF